MKLLLWKLLHVKLTTLLELQPLLVYENRDFPFPDKSIYKSTNG